ncbi:MAG TPA: hypothetical protein VLA88_00635 [Candidatus Saccharimonadales bacterium]|nr:hypothetical protein [Candidatus Saccharimonadales bacterium]
MILSKCGFWPFLFYTKLLTDQQGRILLSYVVVSSQADEKERKSISKINRRGGTTGLLRRSKLFGVLAGIAGVVWVLVPPSLIGWGAFMALGVAGAFAFYFGYTPLRVITRRDSVITSNTDLIALDKEWQAAAQSEDPAWQRAVDQARFVRVRQLAAMTSAEAAPLILAERRKLNPDKFPDTEPEGSA